MSSLYNNPFFEMVDEKFEGREGTAFTADRFRRDYVRLFLVRTRNKFMGSALVCRAPTIPLPFSPYISGNGIEYDLNALCISIDAKQEGNDQFQWTVTCKYSTEMPNGGPADPKAVDSPHLEPPDLEWDFEIVHKALPHDRDGEPFRSSAGQPFTPAPTFEVAYPILSLSRNELNFDYQKANKYAFTLNNKSFLGEERGRVQCFPPKAKLMFRGIIQYWRVSYKLKFKSTKMDPKVVAKNESLKIDEWQPKFLDQGTKQMELVDNGTDPPFLEPVDIISKTGHAITHPVLLNGLGFKADLKDNKDGKPPVADPWYLDFYVYKYEDFSKLLVNGLG